MSDISVAMAFWRDAVVCTERFQTAAFAEVLAGGAVICLQRSSKPGGGSGLGLDVTDLEVTCRVIAASPGAVVEDATRKVSGPFLLQTFVTSRTSGCRPCVA